MILFGTKTQIGACVLVTAISLSLIAPLNAADTGSPAAPVAPVVATPTPTPTPAAPVAPVVATPTPALIMEVVVDELALSRSLIAEKNYRGALTELKRVDRIVSNNADVNNLLGFASRKLGQYPQAGSYYLKALKIDPSHLGALEYQGELFLLQKKAPLAKQNLAKLKRLCGTSCEEYSDLLKAINASTKKK